jgi:hypothetical protein
MRREIQNPELFRTQVRFSAQQTTLEQTGKPHFSHLGEFSVTVWQQPRQTGLLPCGLKISEFSLRIISTASMVLEATRCLKYQSKIYFGKTLFYWFLLPCALNALEWQLNKEHEKNYNSRRHIKWAHLFTFPQLHFWQFWIFVLL